MDKEGQDKSAGVRVSYYLKNPITCPVCGDVFKKEEMLTGRGRLIARQTTDELRRTYEPSKKVRELNPLIYPVTVCPSCYYSAYPEDFPSIVKEHTGIALSQKTKRIHDISLFFPIVDFRRPRNLFTGAASYILAVGCYSFMPKDRAPSFKKGLSALRAAWLFGDLEDKYPGQNFGKLKRLLYCKAADFYERTIAYSQTGEERIESVKHFGPDLDKNYGFQGILFIASLLLFKYGQSSDTEERAHKLESAKRTISRIFGSGKSSKSKPSQILDLSKDLYEMIGTEIERLKGE
ncbi:MAG: DUF2225 domain-containing protein [Spirochaetes bacterium]|nr:DUF2225 domain-containing protein [Spirochaetota bacterium]